MDDDLDKALDRLTMEQKEALASILHAKMLSARKPQTPGEVVLTRTVSGQVKREGEG